MPGWLAKLGNRRQVIVLLAGRDPESGAEGHNH